MTWTTPETVSDSDLVDQTIWNNQVRGNLLHLLLGVEPNTLTNNSGGTLSAGDVVIIDTTADSSITNTTTKQDELVLGVAGKDILTSSTGRVALKGVATVNVQGNVTRGNYLTSSSTAGSAEDVGSDKTIGSFAVALSTYSGGGAGQVSALLLNAFVGGGVPTDSIHWYTAGATPPTGYTEYTAASGRVIVGMQSASVLGNSIGTALGDDESRDTGEHNHTLTDPGHSHGNVISTGGATYSGWANTHDLSSANVNTSTTGISACTAGSIAGTPAPYVSLLALLRS